MLPFQRRIATLFAVTAAVFVVSMAVALVLGRPGVALALGAAGGVLIGLARLAKVLMNDSAASSSDDPVLPLDQGGPPSGEPPGRMG
jgi:hypothetical protein